MLDTYMLRNNLSTGSLLAWYGFNEASGNTLFNEAHKNTSSVSVLSDGGIDRSTNPGFMIGWEEGVFNHGHHFQTGSGYFGGKTVIKVDADFLTGRDGFTIIANLANFDNTNNLDKGKTLFSTMENASDTSGFSIGINGANRVYFHFADLAGNVNRSLSSNYEINDYSVFSIACSPYYTYETLTPVYQDGEEISSTSIDNPVNSKFSYAYHDVVNVNDKANPNWSETTCESCTNFKQSNTLYIGDFHTPSDGYTGYKGYISDVVIFKGMLTPSQRHDVSRAFFTDTISGAAGTVTTKTIQENVITGSGIPTTQVTGTGITGYETIQIQDEILTRDGSYITGTAVSILSGVTGELTGEVIVYATGSEAVARTYNESVFAPEKVHYNSSDYSPYSKKDILFFDPIDSNDIYEVYSYTGKSDRINRAIILDYASYNGEWRESPVSVCEGFADAMCGSTSWSGKVCYPCNKYVGDSSCGDCYKITDTVDDGCEDSDTCESGFNSSGDCKKFVFEECIRRMAAPMGTFNLKQTILPSFKSFYRDKDYGQVIDDSFITRGGNLFINGVLYKEGQTACETKNTNSTEGYATDIYQECKIKSGQYKIEKGFRGVYSGLHSFDLRYRYDYYGLTGDRIFEDDDYIYISPTEELVMFDDTFKDGLDGVDGSGTFLTYVTGASNLTFSGSDYINKDIYLNGVKLVSGLNYTGNSSNGIDIIRSTLPPVDDAKLAFSPRPIFSYRITGSDAGNYKNVGFDLLSEQIWINGIRQIEGVNYIKTAKNSLLNSSIVLTSKEANIYGNYEDFFNDNVQKF